MIAEMITETSGYCIVSFTVNPTLLFLAIKWIVDVTHIFIG